MKQTIIILSIIVTFLFVWVGALLYPSTDKKTKPNSQSVEAVPSAQPKDEPFYAPPGAPAAPTGTTGASPAPDPAKWEHISSDSWPQLLPGKWQGESDARVTADFTHKRKGSKTPWNVMLGESKGSEIDWYGCGFYQSGVAYCRRSNDEESKQGLITIKSKEGTEAIEFNAFNGEFDFKLVKVR